MIDGKVVNPAEFRTVVEIDLDKLLMILDSPVKGNIVIEHSDWMYNDEWEFAEELPKPSHKDVKVGDKIAVTKVNYEELGRVHFAEVVEVYDDLDECIGINPEINGEDTLYMFKGNGDEWRILRDGFEQQHEEESLQHRQAHAYYDDEALSPSYSDAVKAGMTFADYTGVNITEESLDFEPKEEDILRV